MSAKLIVCDTCRFSTAEKVDAQGRTGGQILAGLIEAGLSDQQGIELQRFSCLMGCEHHCNVALRQGGKLAYVLGSFAPTADAAEAICDFAGRYAASETGQVPFKQWHPGIKGHFVARMPSDGDERKNDTA